MEEEKEMSNHTRPASKEDYPSLRKPERLHIGILQERLAYLRRRLADGDHSEGAGPFLAGEASSIEWALEQVDSLYGTDQVDGISKDEMAIAMLESICDSDDETSEAHRHADQIILDLLTPEVKRAYAAVKECSTYWVLWA